MNRFLVYKKPETIRNAEPQITATTESNTESTDNEEDLQKTPPKKKKYNPKYRPEWEDEFKWIRRSKSNVSVCIVCNKNITPNITHIKRHEQTTLHSKNMNKALKTPSLENYGVTEKGKGNALLQKAKIAEYKTVIFLHEHNLPFSLMEHMPKYLQSVAPDSEIVKNINCSRTKATELTKVIAEESLSLLETDLRNKLYSVIIDETTDISTQKSLAIIVRYFDDKSQEVNDRFLGLIRLLKCDAETLTNGVKDLLNKHNIPTENMIGFAADNAAVMMGNKAGVQAKLKELNPTLFVLGCTCHSIHLCASAAAHKLPKSIEQFCRNIFNHFSNSSQRAEGLQEFQQFLNIKPSKMLHPSQTRWLSIQAVVDRILLSWQALKLHFSSFLREDILSNIQSILDSLNTPVVKAYLLFLSYILDIVNKLNLEFQSEKPKVHQLLPKVKSLYRTILRNFIKIDVLNNENISEICPSNHYNFLPIENMYMGAKVESFISEGTIDETELHKMRVNVLSFYIELACQIRKRFQFNDPLLNVLTIFDPKTATSGEVGSVLKIVKLIPQVIINRDVEDLNTEWRLLADIDILKQKAEHLNFFEFWSFVFKMKNELNDPLFPNISVVLKAIMVLPHSSACVERIFSQLNLLKTKQRNRLLVETCDNILQTKEFIKPNVCYNWEPSQSLLKRKINYNN